MSGDLSLSLTLGGLRIANPDDATPPSRDASSEPQDQLISRSGQPEHEQDASLPNTKSNTSTSTVSAREPSRSTPHTFESAAAILKTAQDNLTASRGYLPSRSIHSHSSNASRQGGARPVSTLGVGDQLGAHYGGLRNEPSRSSFYGMPTRSDSRPEALGPSPAISRQPSQLQRSLRVGGPVAPGSGSPAHAGHLPLRRSSKGQGGGYVHFPGAPQAPSNAAQERNLMPVRSNEDWKDRGAAVGVRREVDAEGKSMLRSVRKGVRDFNFGRVLGEGSYSTVYLATDRQTLREYAVKVLEKKHIIKEKKIKYVNIEKNTLNRLTEHPGIVRLYYTFQDETSLYYVLDLCNGGELLGVLKKTGTFDVECVRFYGAQILDAIEYMHSKGVIHRDLKPENVLLDDKMHVKITDFGTAKILDDSRDANAAGPGPGLGGDNGRAASFVGTAEYVSPELLTNKTAGKPSDMWAFGCIVYQLLAGRPPFKGGSEYLTFQKIVKLEYEIPAGFPSAARDLIERCLVLDPARRLTVEHAKNHDFFDGQTFGKELWRMKAPRLKPYVPPSQEPYLIQLNGTSSAPPLAGQSRGPPPNTNGTSRSVHRLITAVPPPTQLDIEWSPVLTRNNERILKLGDLFVHSASIPNSPHTRGDDGHKKFSRFFGGGTGKKRQRLVMVTSSGRIILAPSGGEEKRAKQEISLLASDCVWRTQVDPKGQLIWCVDTGGVKYTFEEPKAASSAFGTDLSGEAKSSVDEWIESLERAKDLAIWQQAAGAGGDAFGNVSTTESPASTLGGAGRAFSVSEGYGDYGGSKDRLGGRGHLQGGGSGGGGSNEGDKTFGEPKKTSRFSKRQSKNGLGAAQF